jgi:hypothetical protein
MANNFVRDPIDHGDFNIWLPLMLAGIHAGGIGALSAELYNDGGVLKLSKGNIGIDNGLAQGKGICIIDTITTISTVGMTAGLWHKVEISVSGTACTITILPIVAASDESTIDAVTKAAYDYEKAGYYLTASKRLIGVVFLRAALALGRIANCESGKLGFKGIRVVDYINEAGIKSIVYIAKLRQAMGDWNMTATNYITITLSIAGILLKNPIISGVIYNDSRSLTFNFNAKRGVDVNNHIGLYTVDTAGNTIAIIRWNNYFTGADFDDIGYNRGIIEVEWES